MSERIGDGVTYRTLQCICDLRTVARLAADGTRARIAAGTDSPSAANDMDQLIEREGCRIGQPLTMRLHQALILAAALPNDDFEAFQTATAILIADRLQHGLGNDDLFWHWDAFRDHYALSPPHGRAALMHGFHRMEADGLVALEDPPDPAAFATEDRDTVLAALDRDASASALAIAAALGAGTPAHGFWQRHCLPHLSPEAPAALLRGIRHLFETRPAWEPYGGTTFDPARDEVPVIPVVLP